APEARRIFEPTALPNLKESCRHFSLMSLKSPKLLLSLTSVALLSAVAFYVARLNPASGDRRALFIFAVLLAAACGLVASLIFYLRRSGEKRLEDSRRALEEELARARETAELHMSAVESLAIAIDAKDQTTHGHVRRSRVYAVELGRLLNASGAELEALRAGALLHDIGKLAVPEYILNKPGKLTAAEFEKMKVHATVGARIVSRVRFPYPVEDVVRFHHEKWDGTGYPEGLKGEL